MDFSSISNKNMIGKLLRLPLKLIPENTIMPILQGKIRGKRWIIDSGTHGCWLGSYEYEKRILFEKLVRENSVVFDIGANVGYYTLIASELVGKNGKVFAFEPLPRNVFYLRRHLDLNDITNVTIIEKAVSDVIGELSFDCAENSYEGHLSNTGKLIVKSITLDSLLAGDFPYPNYLKIDIEGAEARLLAGAKNLIAKSKPIIFLATHSKKIHQDCCNILSSLNYNLSPIDPRIQDIKETDEIIAVPK